MPPLFFIIRSSSLSLFFSLSFAGLSPTFSFSLSFSFSIFKICGHDNLSKLNIQDNTDTEKNFRFPFSSLLTLQLSVLHKMRVAMRFPAKYPRVPFGLPYLLIELFYIGMPVVRTDGRLVGRTDVRSRDNQNFSDG